MKKILLIIVSILFICSFNNKVLAIEKLENAKFTSSEWLDGISYVKYNNKYYYFMNARAIRNTSTGNIAYCIEPFLNLVDGSIYDYYNNYNPIFNLTQEQWKKINLIAYYGYGYDNHLDSKWISITQMMIWRVVEPNSSFNWIDNVNDRNVIFPYESEIMEIESLLEEHDKIPVFDLEKSISIGKTVELHDFAGVVNNFEVKEVDSGLDIVIEGNMVRITANEVGEKTFILAKKGGHNNSFKYFYSKGSQSIIERSSFEPLEAVYKVRVAAGKIIIKKVDSVTKDTIPFDGASLIGAIYRIEDEMGNTVGEIDIGEDNMGFFDNLPFGNYTITEVRAGTGYSLDANSYNALISEDNLEVPLTLENEIISSEVLIKKFYGSKDDLINSTMKNEKGIRFDVYNNKNELFATGVTDDKGELRFKLPYGKYVIKQISSTEGYQKVRDIDVVVDENSPRLLEYTLNDLKVDVPNAYIEDSNSYSVLSLLFLTLLLGGLVIVK